MILKKNGTHFFKAKSIEGRKFRVIFVCLFTGKRLELKKKERDFFLLRFSLFITNLKKRNKNVCKKLKLKKMWREQGGSLLLLLSRDTCDRTHKLDTHNFYLYLYFFLLINNF